MFLTFLGFFATLERKLFYLLFPLQEIKFSYTLLQLTQIVLRFEIAYNFLLGKF